MDRLRLRTSASPPTSPPLSPTVSSSSVSRVSPIQRRTQPLKSQIPSLPKRLLVPTSCSKPTLPDLELRPVKSKSSSNRITRGRADSAPPEPLQYGFRDERRWFNSDVQFEVVEEDVKISGYQIFAVEKWIVDRSRTTVLLTVYTGDPKDTITVTALAPEASLSDIEARQEWERIIHELRKDGARPRETDKGLIMVTSLANFRSDYTVVHIPDGDFLAHRQQLYVNINLLRMGCSGRSALTLQEPSDATKDRFISMFHFGDALRTGARFRQTVLELVRLIQCGLSLFDLFPVDYQEQDGLLCDNTVEGIQKWVANVGEPYMKVEPTERVADPSIVSAIISLALSVRNKLSAIGFQNVPKDPFLHPRRFTRSLAAYVNQRLAQPPSASSGTTIHHAYLNLALIKHIDVAYEKYKSSEAYKLHRVVLNKLDDITSVTTSAMTSSKDPSHGRSMSLSLSAKEREAESLVEPTSDLAGFISKIGALRRKDCGASVRYLWVGRFDQLERKRQESIWSDAEEEREKERERSDSEDEGDTPGVFPWPSKVTKKIENWAGEFGRSRLKKTSVDMTPSKGKRPENLTNDSVVPFVVVSREQDGPMSGFSSGQASPISPSASYNNLGIFSSAHASALGIDEEVYSQRVKRFNRKWPSPVTPVRKRAFSWADQQSAVGLLDEVYVDIKAMEATVFPFGISYDPNVFLWTKNIPTPGGEKPPKKKKPKEPFVHKLKRSNSFDDLGFVDPDEVLSRERLQTDVELCIQCLIMHRRKAHVEAVITVLQALIQSSSSTNEMLLKYHEEHSDLLKELAEKCQIAADIEEAISTTDSASADTDALRYEANFLDVAGLWRMAQTPRLRVFAIRDRVFGVRNRRRFPLSTPSQVHVSGHGRFNRVQKGLDGSEHLVDFLGRTESEVEEEGELPEDLRLEGEEDSEDDHDMRIHTESEGAHEGRFQALNNWLLALFTKWGRVLGGGGAAHPTHPEPRAPMGIGGDHAPPEKEAKHDFDEVGDPQSDLHIDDQYRTPVRRTPNFLANGHHHRLSTVGEEEEPISMPNTPTIPGLPRLHSH